MKIIKASVEPVSMPVPYTMYQILEGAGRTCYQSEQVEGDTPAAFLGRVIRRGHEAVLEHATISLKFICDRGVSHELVRHRLASYCQESTRYCNYMGNRFGSEITVIEPCFWEPESYAYTMWKRACEEAEGAYMGLVNNGASAQEARSVLPNSLKTSVVVTMNIREWRHFFLLRYFGTTGSPHPQMVEVSSQAWELLSGYYPVLFEDLQEKAKKV